MVSVHVYGSLREEVYFSEFGSPLQLGHVTHFTSLMVLLHS